jgi:hypothetical protein
MVESTTAEFEAPPGERQVVELLGVSPTTLKHWRWVGKGPRYVKLCQQGGIPPPGSGRVDQLERDKARSPLIRSS